MTLEKVCALADKCKIAGTAGCNALCFPYVLTHGSNGTGGFWSMTNVPKKYRHLREKDLEILKGQNPIPYAVAKKYLSDITGHVKNGTGFFLYSIPNKDNPKGTGTGKSTTAAILVNEYVRQRIIEHSRGVRKIDGIPGLYVRMSELQNIYNSQFRGPQEMRDEASLRYYRFKKNMMDAELLVLDDIGLRDANTLVNEVYEVIDHRNNQTEMATVFTSNLPLQKVAELLSDQITSRIEEMTEQIPYTGKDNRKKFME